MAVWAFGIISLTIGLMWVNSSIDNPIRLALIFGGPALVIGFKQLARARTATLAGAIRRRVAIALFVGVVIAISQTAAMLELPLYFRMVLGFGPLLAMVALVPLFGALIVAGPVAGILLERVTPRWLVGGGTLFVGRRDLVLAAMPAPSRTRFMSRSSSHACSSAPGSSWPPLSGPPSSSPACREGLPATAAALNKSSVAVGSRVGIVIVSAVVAEVAVSTYASTARSAGC